MGSDAVILKKTNEGYEVLDLETRFWGESYQRGDFPKIIQAICEAWLEGKQFVYTSDCAIPTKREFEAYKMMDKQEILDLVASFLDSVKRPK